MASVDHKVSNYRTVRAPVLTAAHAAVSTGVAPVSLGAVPLPAPPVKKTDVGVVSDAITNGLAMLNGGSATPAPIVISAASPPPMNWTPYLLIGALAIGWFLLRRK